MTDILSRSETVARLRAQADEDIVFRSALAHLDLYFQAHCRAVAERYVNLMFESIDLAQAPLSADDTFGRMEGYFRKCDADMTAFLKSVNGADPTYAERVSYLKAAHEALCDGLDEHILDMGIVQDVFEFLTRSAL